MHRLIQKARNFFCINITIKLNRVNTFHTHFNTAFNLASLKMKYSHLNVLFMISCGLSSLKGDAQIQNSVESVLKYNREQFKKEVPRKPHFVLYFAPWCGECKTALGMWEELAFKNKKEEKSQLVIAKVDCQAEGDLCAYQDISDYPTIKLYRPGQPDALGVRFRGIPDLQAVESFLNKHMGNAMEEGPGGPVSAIPEPEGGHHFLQDENFDEAMGTVSKAFVLFCASWSSKCKALTPMWKEVAKHFKFEEDFIMASVDCIISKSTCNENEVRSYPSLLWIHEGIVVDKYESQDRSVEALKKYVMEKLGRAEVSQHPPGFEQEAGPSDVTKLTKSNFYETINGPKLVFVHYWTAWCSECMNMDGSWDSLGFNYNDPNGKVLVARVDCIIDKQICEEQKVDDYPTLSLYSNGKVQQIYTGEHKVKEMSEFLDAAIKAKSEL